jgi:hypothetical protein
MGHRFSQGHQVIQPAHQFQLATDWHTRAPAVQEA